jgi:hypothetical protein
MARGGGGASARSQSWCRHQVADVLHLAGDPAGDVVGEHDVSRRLMAPMPLRGSHHKALVQGLSGLLDVERVDGQDIAAQQAAKDGITSTPPGDACRRFS